MITTTDRAQTNAALARAAASFAAVSEAYSKYGASDPLEKQVRAWDKIAATILEAMDASNVADREIRRLLGL